MWIPKYHRKGVPEKNRKGKLSEKASSFNGRSDIVVAEMLPRPRTVSLPDLLAGIRSGGSLSEDLGTPPKLTKLLLNVTVQRSLGAVRLVLPLEATVEHLISAALRQYAKEHRMPVLQSMDAFEFDLHYSQFSLESLDRDEKVEVLGSRNFFLCRKKTVEGVTNTARCGGAPTRRCTKEADKSSKEWLTFMDFVL